MCGFFRLSVFFLRLCDTFCLFLYGREKGKLKILRFLYLFFPGRRNGRFLTRRFLSVCIQLSVYYFLSVLFRTYR